MSEWTILEYLKNLRLTGDDSFKSTTEIKDGLNLYDKKNTYTYPSVRRKLINLRDNGFIEDKIGGVCRDWHIRFRIKERYLNDNKDLQAEQ